ncbi:ArsR/SmtB family transcription factor [Paradevosia shaoguanensis]|uniref:Metalloregulator ArsR/SmtB family transcription factor n=1 Tax=Paradevosia shaoguanensis TaxID=1335043 RepID=A0AA41QPE0_9HYPH|nr:metalloregulator ArsR/SmtB family transcription factor [Paradevosia shaoguanensis]MCF1743846.1 metalloregulator ArsR/SmtB family transcription factor [Paradevosia shaoguanensis]MCI0128329.1 metalloregulator ArsR/SmtB family transcription factor [Paradevosia shaoguanensis]QMV00198.1 metalloregulator ArsR/SmtB family transcription factor [Devosia sp. D6-9]
MATDKLSLTLSALADPTRRGILARLSLGEATVKELAEPYDMSLAAVSKHLKVLEGAGLISRGKEAQWRPCRLEAAPLMDVSTWLEDYRKHWEESMDRLDAYLTRLQSGDPDGNPN